MFANGWVRERFYIFLLLILVLLLGVLTQHFLWAALLCLLGYCIWQWYQLYLLHSWLKEQSSVRHAPHLYGVLGDVVGSILKSMKNHKRSRRQLQRLLRLFDSSAQNAPDATLVLGVNKEIVWLNKAAQQEFVLRKKKDLGVRISHVFRNEAFEKFIERAELGSHITLESPRQQGRYLDLRISPYPDGGLLLSARDITGLVMADKTRRDFVSNASHELKTPLTVMMGYLEILESEQGVDPELLPIIHSAAVQAARMHSLVDDLLCLSRLEAEGSKHRQKVQIASLVRGILEELTGLEDYQKRQIVCNLDEKISLKAAPKDLLSAFSNLIINALIHTPENTRIEIACYKHQGEVIFSVRDYGYGIEPEHLPRITERFYRAQEGRARSDSVAATGRGTGLGLAIVKHVLQSHHGRLEVSSNLGEGAEFKCIFPH